MQHERQTLGRSERVEHHEQRQTHRVSEQRLVLRVTLDVLDADHRLRQPAADIVLLARPPRSQHVERHACDDGREPTREVGDRLRVRATQPQPRLLHSVVGIADRAQHPVGDRTQPSAMALELPGQQIVIAHHP